MSHFASQYKESQKFFFQVAATADAAPVKTRRAKPHLRHVDASIHNIRPLPPAEVPHTVSTQFIDGDTQVQVHAQVQAQAEQTLIHQIATEFRPKLYRFVMKHVGHHDEANDIVQHTIAEAARVISTFRGESQLSTWLCGIALNYVRNYLNRSPNRRYDFVEIDENLDSMEAVSTDPSIRLEYKQTMAAVSKAIESLPEEMRSALVLVAIDECSYEEASKLLDVPLGTIRSRVCRARSQIRKLLAEQLIFPTF
jgi:RNA polymerase sigma factor (sigma-70 family)